MNQEKHLYAIFKNLVDTKSISKEMRKSMKKAKASPGTMYGLCKVHKQGVGGCSPVRPILFYRLPHITLLSF